MMEVAENFKSDKMSLLTAQKMMKVAEIFKSEPGSFLDIQTKALYLLAQ